MNYHNTFILGFVFLLFSCSSDPENVSETPLPNNSENKIMPLGASRVAGARPQYESYRYELWKLLVGSGAEFDFIGTENDNANYPDFNSLSFDRDHEGRGGINSSEIRLGIDEWLRESGTPDIVLFSSPGGNDDLTSITYEGVLENINAIVDAIQAINPNATIIIEQAAPPMTSEQTPEFLAIYNQIIEDVVTIAESQSTSTSKVLTVDMATGFTDAMLADDVHYNEAGAQFIANRYFEILQTILSE
ncbi:lysophospholipase L1-like esterase [Flagellimonas meridianipacifica]|uniref:Lysophospholipase L1-like esterase n=2 Tax=Flagellimonas meridianipacifica TaxID=1080225 RepID=A0A2T0MJ65_9FLAO|nr:lysophospholipase L1-like esterase [Allomuricauda pacifica]